MPLVVLFGENNFGKLRNYDDEFGAGVINYFC